MAVSTLQNFFKTKIKVATGAGTGNIYVDTKPTPINGWLVISPGSESLREIIKYTGTGTDGTGDYVTIANIADRGLGGTTAQAHAVGEAVRMNYTAEHQKEIDDTIEAIVNAGAPLASDTVKGRVELSVAPADADEPIAVGDNDPRLPDSDLQDALAGGDDFGTPSASNKFVTEGLLGTGLKQVYNFAGSPHSVSIPANAKAVLVRLWGAGGGGGNGENRSAGGAGSANAAGGGGGGGGMMHEKLFSRDLITSPVTLTIGQGGTAGTNGGDTTFGSLLTAMGGRAGANGSIGNTGIGGAGGSQFANAEPRIVTSTQNSLSTGGGTASDTTTGGNAEYGGAGGGSHPNTAGGSSIYGGGGGGGGGTVESSTTRGGGAGGRNNSYTAAGGASGGAVNTAGTNGSAFGEAGGGGGSSNNGSGAGRNGGNGGLTAGGGGGGGGNSGSSGAGTGGTGGNGYAEIIIFF